jgi:hypothetical protein
LLAHPSQLTIHPVKLVTWSPFWKDYPYEKPYGKKSLWSIVDLCVILSVEENKKALFTLFFRFLFLI